MGSADDDDDNDDAGDAMARARIRPAHVTPPAHWQADDGPPEPKATPHIPQKIKDMPDPVRYGDWERKGIAVDF